MNHTLNLAYPARVLAPIHVPAERSPREQELDAAALAPITGPVVLSVRELDPRHVLGATHKRVVCATTECFSCPFFNADRGSC